jgi:hypothetical protein
MVRAVSERSSLAPKLLITHNTFFFLSFEKKASRKRSNFQWMAGLEFAPPTIYNENPSRDRIQFAQR